MIEINGVQIKVPSGDVSIKVDDDLKVLTELSGSSVTIKIGRDPSKVYNNPSSSRSVPASSGESSSGISSRRAG